MIDFADVTARAPMRSLEVGETPVRKVRLGQFSADSPKVARLVVDLSAKSPYRIIDGTDGVRIVFGETTSQRSGARAARRAANPRADSCRLGAPVDSAPARPLAIEPLVMPALPEPQAAPGAAAEAAPLPSRATSARPAVRPATSARRSAWTSRTATCRTSSASSPTSRASTSSSTLESPAR